MEGIDAVLFADCKKRIDHGRSLCSIVGSGEQVIFSAQGQRANGIFDLVVVYQQIPIAQICTQRIPASVAVLHRFSDLAFGKRAFYLLEYPFAQLVDDWQGFF
ncbi:hypothetical protein D3C87_1592120 [compost metagenome]